MSIASWLKSLWEVDAQKTERVADTNPVLRETVAELKPRQSRWVEVPEGRIYLRRARHPGVGETIDIPNVAFDEEARGKGAFTRYLGEIEIEAQRAGLDGVYVENILNPRLEQFLRERGYNEGPAWAPGPPCLYKRFSNVERADETPDLSRRDFLMGLGAIGGAAGIPGLPNVGQSLHPEALTLAMEYLTQDFTGLPADKIGALAILEEVIQGYRSGKYKHHPQAGAIEVDPQDMAKALEDAAKLIRSDWKPPQWWFDFARQRALRFFGPSEPEIADLTPEHTQSGNTRKEPHQALESMPADGQLSTAPSEEIFLGPKEEEEQLYRLQRGGEIEQKAIVGHDWTHAADLISSERGSHTASSAFGNEIDIPPGPRLDARQREFLLQHEETREGGPDLSCRGVLGVLGAAVAASAAPQDVIEAAIAAAGRALHPLATDLATNVWQLHEPYYAPYGPNNFQDLRAEAIQYLTDLGGDLVKDTETFGDKIRAYQDAARLLESGWTPPARILQRTRAAEGRGVPDEEPHQTSAAGQTTEWVRPVGQAQARLRVELDEAAQYPDLAAYPDIGVVYRSPDGALAVHLGGGDMEDIDRTPGAFTAARLQSDPLIGIEYYRLYDAAGKQVEQADVAIIGNRAHIVNIEAEGGKNTVGVHALRLPGKKLQADYPEITTVKGLRSSGAGPGRTQEVEFQHSTPEAVATTNTHRRELEAATARLSAETGLPHTPATGGEIVAGIYGRTLSSPWAGMP